MNSKPHPAGKPNRSLLSPTLRKHLKLLKLQQKELEDLERKQNGKPERWLVLRVRKLRKSVEAFTDRNPHVSGSSPRFGQGGCVGVAGLSRSSFATARAARSMSRCRARGVGTSVAGRPAGSAPSRLPNRCRASIDVYVVPPILIASRMTPRTPRLIQR